MVDVLIGQLAMHAELPAGVAALQDFCFPPDPSFVDRDGKLIWLDGDVVLTFSEHAGTPVRMLEPGMVKWILRKGFSDTVKQTVRDICYHGVYPARPDAPTREHSDTCGFVLYGEPAACTCGADPSQAVQQ